jgi:hypothetical protein
MNLNTAITNPEGDVADFNPRPARGQQQDFAADVAEDYAHI